MGGKMGGYGLAGGEGPWPELIPYVERAAVYLLLEWDKVSRTWGKRPRPVPPGALSARIIAEGVGLSGEESSEAKECRAKHYVMLKVQYSDYFENPLEREGVSRYKRAACFALTAEGKNWAAELLKEAADGKPWLLDWRK